MRHEGRDEGIGRSVPVVTLLSGGLDSAVMAAVIAEQGRRQYPLFINYGQRCVDREWESVCRICGSLALESPARLDIEDYARLIPSGLTNVNLDIVNDAFLPGRNALFIVFGAAYAYQCKAAAVAIGLLSDEFSLFPDQTKEFIHRMSQVVHIMLGRPCTIVAPMMSLCKQDVIAMAAELGISNTYSCHLGGTEPCGNCISCKEFLAKEE